MTPNSKSLVASSYRPQDHQPIGSTIYNGLGLHHQPLTKKLPSRLAYNLGLLEAFSQLRFTSLKQL